MLYIVCPNQNTRTSRSRPLTVDTMKKRSLLLCVCLCVLLQSAFSQGCPPNIDFEAGDFSNWECFVGNTFVRNGVNVINLNPSPPTRGRHEIIAASDPVQDLDPYGKFPKLCPYGGRYSVKLGNNATGAQAEGLSYTFTVPLDVDTFTFTYFYAVVFEDPNHNTWEQPRFFVTAYDVETGNIVSCASYDYVSNGTIPGFEVSPANPGVLFKKWTPASLQFAGLNGRQVRLEFKTADCTLTGHFGYAYVDVVSACSNILATAPYCIETNSLILNAPYGFKQYTWYTSDFSAVVGTGQSITLSPPPATSGFFWVDAEPYPGYGCRDTFQAVVQPLPVPDTPAATTYYAYCQFQPPQTLTATATTGHQLLWYTTPTGGIPSANAPTPSTQVSGEYTYYVSQKALFGCESFRRKITVKVFPTPVTSFTINAVRQCESANVFIFQSTTTNMADSIYRWEFGDGTIIDTANATATYSYKTYGNFSVKLKVQNAGICYSEKTLPVTVVPKPLAAFNYPNVMCEQQTLLTITDQSGVPNNLSAINRWWWTINGNVTQVQNPAAFTPGAPGPLPVKLVVTTAEGCASDTNSTIINVRYKPMPAFRYGKLMCDNEIIQFTDLSAMPAAATGESLAQWDWQFDGTVSSSLQHPPQLLAAGQHDARLIVASNYGCTSQADSSFTVYAKPRIKMDISDSCVLRTIRYTATDLNNSTGNWYWDFGTGLQRGTAVSMKSYIKEGSRPFTVIAESVNGCKDTLIRPFTIYDNDARAGRDTIAAIDEPVQLDAKGPAGTKYVWTPATGLNNAFIGNPVATLDRDQTYQMDAITKEGCDAHSTIFIKRYKGPDIYIPNAFTPNGDRVNDEFHVVPVGIRSFGYLCIYNRYGQLIFKTTNQHLGWDGRFKGIDQPAGTYVAVSEAIDYKGNVMKKRRTITLLR